MEMNYWWLADRLSNMAIACGKVEGVCNLLTGMNHVSRQARLRAVNALADAVRDISGGISDICEEIFPERGNGVDVDDDKKENQDPVDIDD